MKTITDFKLKDKKVLLRCDFNVTIKDGNILNDDKIKASLKTINYLIKQEAKIILMSHLGKIKEESDKETNSLETIYKTLKLLLNKNTNIYFSPNTRGIKLEEMINNLKSGEVLLMENTRFEDVPGNKESGNDKSLSKYWASLADIYINDAFGNTHRKHASNCGITRYIESGIGFLIEEELKHLNLLFKPELPFTVIMGGAKAADKIYLISNILKRSDYLLLGGGIANTFLSVSNEVGKSLISEEALNEAALLLDKYPEKIIMPIDVIVLNKNQVIPKFINEISSDDYIYDIGPETIKLYKNYIDRSQTIFINGTVGMYEDTRFEIGTKNILDICSKSKAKVILGGGDALTSADHFKNNNFYFKSTGGGATLKYIGTGRLDCREK